MTNFEFWTHIKQNMQMAFLGGAVNFLYSIMPIRKFKSWESFWITAFTRFIGLTLCVFFGLLGSFIIKSIGMPQYSETASALCALGGEKLLRALHGTAIKYIENYNIKKD
jgi:hypothetical protein